MRFVSKRSGSASSNRDARLSPDEQHSAYAMRQHTEFHNYRHGSSRTASCVSTCRRPRRTSTACPRSRSRSARPRPRCRRPPLQPHRRGSLRPHGGALHRQRGGRSVCKGRQVGSATPRCSATRTELVRLLALREDLEVERPGGPRPERPNGVVLVLAAAAAAREGGGEREREKREVLAGWSAPGAAPRPARSRVCVHEQREARPLRRARDSQCSQACGNAPASNTLTVSV